MKLRQARKVQKGFVREWASFWSFAIGRCPELLGSNRWRMGTVRAASRRVALSGALLFFSGFTSSVFAAYDICLIQQASGDYRSLANVFDSGTCSSLVGAHGGVGYFFGTSLVVGADVSMGGTRLCYGSGGPVTVATWKDCELIQGQMSAAGGEDVFFLVTELTTVLGGGLAERPVGSEGTSTAGGGGGAEPTAAGIFQVDIQGPLGDMLLAGTLLGVLAAVWLGYRQTRRTLAVRG